jgi:hypothetical protein
MPSASELSDTATAQEAAARLRSLLQQGATSESWDLELSKLADYAERVAFGPAIRARQISDAPSEELRKRRQEAAAKLSATERATLATRLSQLSPPAKKRLREWAAHQSLQIPAPELVASPITAIEGARRLLSIIAYGKTLKRKLKPLLWEPSVGRGRPVSEAARGLVMFLALDYRSAAGHSPARTANPRAPGPFARLVTEALRLQEPLTWMRLS